MLEHLETLKTALGVRKYVVASTAGQAAGAAAIWLGALGMSAFFAQWALFVAVLLALLFWFTLTYATNLRLAQKPRLVCDDIRVHNLADEQYVRVQVRNTSLEGIKGLKARLNKLTDSVGAWQRGEMWDEEGRRCQLDLPIQLFTQERLKEALKGGDLFARPFDLAANEPKSIEIFQARYMANTNVLQILVYGTGERHSLIAPSDAQFDCTVHGAGPPLSFAVTYTYKGPPGGYVVHLVDDDGNVVAGSELFHKDC